MLNGGGPVGSGWTPIVVMVGTIGDMPGEIQRVVIIKIVVGVRTAVLLSVSVEAFQRLVCCHNVQRLLGFTDSRVGVEGKVEESYPKLTFIHEPLGAPRLRSTEGHRACRMIGTYSTEASQIGTVMIEKGASRLGVWTVMMMMTTYTRLSWHKAEQPH